MKTDLEQLDFVEEHGSPSKTKEKVLSYVLGSIVWRKVTCIQCQSAVYGTTKSTFITHKEIEGSNLVTPNSEFVGSIKEIAIYLH